jgi:aldehyde:ferredoxin oxidoreductase
MVQSGFIYGGYVGRILRVNLTAGSFQDEALTNELARHYLGGAGMAACMLYDELVPGIDPFSPEKKDIS